MLSSIPYPAPYLQTFLHKINEIHSLCLFAGARYSTTNLPSVGKGKYVWQCVFPLLFTVVFADPPASQKTLENPSLAGALQFCRSRNSFSQGKPLDHTCRMVEGLDAVWANFCPSKPRLPSFIGGKKQVGQPLPGNLGSKNNLKEDPVMFLDWMLAGSFVLDLVAALAVRASVR